ncbi:hypothetical protein vBOeSunk162_14 [Oenococcus phage vB_OeS_unk162]|nr:hypothetical protein vBOeSunk162_14 [Oenococcus phage vB_OeS_unk162]QNO11527.1 hypothetical protein [Oenococcus phage Vinitor-27]
MANKTIKIQPIKPVIPIEVGSLKFEFNYADKNIAKISPEINDFFKNFQQTNDLDENRKQLGILVDKLFGSGLFEKLYKQTPSLIDCMGIVGQIVIMIGQQQQAKLDMKDVSQFVKDNA